LARTCGGFHQLVTAVIIAENRSATVGRLTINLAAAVAAAASDRGTELTLSELLHAYCCVRLDGSDLRLRKWTQAFGSQSAWSFTSEQLQAAAVAMREHGYKPATVNRDLSSLGHAFLATPRS
jgi:hypothetical protein